MSLWQIAVWVGPTICVAAFITLLVLYPAIMVPIVKAIAGFFTMVLSYRVGCALLAAIAAGFAVDYWRHSHDDAVFAARTAMFEKAQVARDKRIADETREAVWKDIANETAKNAEAEKEQKEFHDALAPLPAGDVTCRVGDNVERLRKLAGQTGRRPASSKRVPKTTGEGFAAGLRRKLGLPGAVGGGSVGAKQSQPAH